MITISKKEKLYMMLTRKTVEATGTVNQQNQIILDEPLSFAGRVRIIIFMPEDTDDEIDWLRSAAVNPAFDFLKDSEEDIYTLEDGRPFHA
jgi:hypothetical protein